MPLMNILFSKYHGAGNDFILIDQRKALLIERNNQALIATLCHRHFGIGADGLMLLENHPGADFEMVYFNADGGLGSFCGNGSRCIVAFAQELGVVNNNCTFLAADGMHQAFIKKPDWIEIKMKNVDEIQFQGGGYFLNTGSPHHIEIVDDLGSVDIVGRGKNIRNASQYQPNGTNVNFIQLQHHALSIGTYERGVEDETLACGTGITAAALVYHQHCKLGIGLFEIPVSAKGGKLSVRFEFTKAAYTDIWLCGPVKKVFQGEVDLGVVI